MKRIHTAGTEPASVRKLRASSICKALLCASMLAGLGHGQDATPVAANLAPEEFGFTEFVVSEGDLEVTYFVSTGGGLVDTTEKRPLVIYLQGSGPTPIYYGEPPRVGSSVMFDARDFPDHHFVVIGKPGLPFHGPEKRVESEQFRELNSLQYRVRQAVLVARDLASKPWIDTRQLAVVGHSEGSDVAPWVALECELITHVAVLAPGVVSQMFDFIVQERKEASRGEKTAEEADRNIEEIRAAYRDIFSDPQSTVKTWRGETYKRWSSFFTPALDAFVQLDVPIFAVVCRDDENTPCESGEILELEFIRRGKTNLTYDVWPTDHYFDQVEEEGETVSRREDVLAAVKEWL